MRIILDTNLWISYLLSKKLIAIDELLKSQPITILFSLESLEEFLAVSQRPKLRKYFSNEDLSDILMLFDQYGELITIESDVQICRDEKDNFLLNLAKDGNADFLITGDKDLLDLQTLETTQILTYKQFLNKI